jgi:hypothetical protein
VKIPYEYWTAHKYNGGAGVSNLYNMFSGHVWSAPPQKVKQQFDKSRVYGCVGTKRFIKYIQEIIGSEFVGAEMIKNLANINYINTLKDSEIAQVRSKQHAQWINLKQTDYDNNANVMHSQPIANTIIQELQEMVETKFVPKAMYEISVIDRAKKLISTSVIKRVDVFKTLVRHLQEVNDSESIGSILHKVLKLAKVPYKMINVIGNLGEKYGINIVLSTIYDEYVFDSILENNIKSSLCSYLRKRIILSFGTYHEYTRFEAEEVSRFVSQMELYIVNVVDKKVIDSFGP